MTDQASSGTSSAPGAPAPSISPAPVPAEFDRGSSGSFVRDRTRQLAQTMQQPAPSEPPAGHAEQEHAGDAQQQQRQPQTPPPQQKIKIGDAEYDAAYVQSAIAEHTEAQVRKSGMPQSAEQYEVRNSEGFQLPQGVSNFAFDMADPTLAAARKFALANNLTQQQFSGMLDLFVASKSGELLHQVQARDANLQQLGPAASQRVEAISTWLSARAGKDGAAVGNFLRQFPSAPIVRAMENLIKQFSSQGGADFSQSHRAEEDQAGKIPGYDQMTFTQRRVAQMTQMLSRPRLPRRRPARIGNE